MDAVLPSDNQLPAFPDVSLTGLRHLLLSSISNPPKNPIDHVFNLQAPPTLLDTSALRSRAQLAKKRAPRTRPSRAARKGTTPDVEDAAEDWLYRDSTGYFPSFYSFSSISAAKLPNENWCCYFDRDKSWS